MNQYNTIGFHPGNSRIHQLNATVKLLFLLNGNKFALLLNSFCFSQY